MSGSPVPTYREIAKVARRLGFMFYREAKGSHEIWRRDTDGRQTTIPNYGKTPIKQKTLKAILHDLGIHWKEFRRLAKG